MASVSEYFLMLPLAWQNSPRFPTARSGHADSYIAVIHYYNDVLLSERAAVPIRPLSRPRCARSANSK
jgi:hypothetical protein